MSTSPVCAWPTGRASGEPRWPSPRGWSPRAGFLTGIGLHPVEHPSGAGDYIPSDTFGRAEVAGVWLAGNVTDPFAQVGASAAAGAMAGAQINADLILEETANAVAAYESPFSAASEAKVAAVVGGERAHGL